MLHEITAEWSAGTAGRGVFNDTEVGCEHPAVDRRLWGGAIDSEEKDRHACRRHVLERGHVADGTVHGGAIAQRNEKERHSAGDLLNGKIRSQVAFLETDRSGRESASLGRRLERRSQLRHP